MIDFLKCEARISPDTYLIENDYAILGRLKLIVQHCKRTFFQKKYECLERGLLFSITDNKLTVTNSLHKFYLGNNYGDFTFSNILSAIAEIEYLTNIHSSEFRLVRLEFGINIELEKSVKDYLPLFTDYKDREFDKMRSNRTWYGIKYHLTEYALKLYDKSLQVKIKDRIDLKKNIMRIEIQLHKIRGSQGIHSLNDLTLENKITSIYAEFLKKILQINCENDENLSALNSRERELYYAGKSDQFWKLEKSINTNTAKSKKKRYGHIRNEIPSKNIGLIIIGKIEEKFKSLMCINPSL